MFFMIQYFAREFRYDEAGPPPECTFRPEDVRIHMVAHIEQPIPVSDLKELV